MKSTLIMWLVLVPVFWGAPRIPVANATGVTVPDPETRDQDAALAALRDAANTAAAQDKKEKDTERPVFESGSLSLQTLNPEISVTGDMLGVYQSGNDDLPTYDTNFRGMGLHLEAYLDPYSRFKAAVGVAAEGAELGEMYYTRYGLLGSANLTLGKFRQQFGVVNRWHKHALDTFDFPLALRRIFGNGGLNQTGLSLDMNTATGSLIHGLTVQATDGENPVLFGGNSKNRPSILAHYKLYQDLSPSTYLELGGTGLVGWNDTWMIDAVPGTDPVEQHERLTTGVYGIDVTLLWEPTSNMRYRNFQWRSEAYFMDKEILVPDGSGQDTIKPWGFYSLMQTKLTRTMELGARFDYYAPEVRDYATASGDLSLAPLVQGTTDAYRQGISGWLTWWQSPFVKFRAGYAHETGDGTGPSIDSVAVQMVFAAGPHKHDRY